MKWTWHWLRHAWGQWERYDVKVGILYGEDAKQYEGIERRQKRRCEICGLEQERTIQRAFRAA